MDDIRQIKQTVRTIASENCVDEAVIGDFVFHPERFIIKIGYFWKHVDNERNSPSRMADEWIKRAIVEYDQFHNDVILDHDYPSWTVGGSSLVSIDDIIGLHLRNKFILSADIKRFYDHINYDIVQKHLPPSLRYVIKSIYFSNDKVGLKRGLKASSAISDVVGKRVIDTRIKRMIYENDFREHIAYSRYCDDLLFSGQNRSELRDVEARLKNELLTMGFELNKDKTRLKPTNSNTILGRRIHNGRIIISKAYRNRARLKYYNALKSYEYYDEDNLESILRTLAIVETALGTANYIQQYNNVNDDTINQLKKARATLLKQLQEKDNQSPFV